MTSYHAVIVQGALKAGDKVGIIGLGGLGQVGARVAVVKGAGEVHVAEINRAVWPLADEIGAASVVENASEWSGRDFDLIVDFAGFAPPPRRPSRRFGSTGASWWSAWAPRRSRSTRWT